MPPHRDGEEGLCISAMGKTWNKQGSQGQILASAQAIFRTKVLKTLLSCALLAWQRKICQDRTQ